MGAKNKRLPDMAVIKRLYYTRDKLQTAIDEYEREALPNTRVMSSLSVSKSLISDVEKTLKMRL